MWLTPISRESLPSRSQMATETGGVGLAPVFHLFFVGPGGAFVAAAHPRLSLENTFPRLTFYRTALPAKLG